jgi:hypothetical protein
VEREDDGVIDLFAIHQRSSAAPAKDIPPDLFSAPPPAFTTDLYGEGGDGSVDDLGNPFAKKPRKKLFIAAGAAGLLVIGILVASFSGGPAERTATTSAAGRAEAAPAALPVAAAPPVITPVLPVVAAAPSHVPAPPTTGAPATVAAAPRSARPSGPAKARVAAGGPKLTKVQSAGVASK